MLSKQLYDISRKIAAKDVYVWTFYECEHGGDMDMYAADVTSSGGEILDQKLNDDECVMKVKVKDWDSFIERFKNTETFEFCSLSDFV